MKQSLCRSLYWLCCLPVVWTGCATQKQTYERGWLGGKFVTAKPAESIWVDERWGPVIRGFPSELKPRQKGGVLITDLAPETPLALAGIKEGDLILAVDQRPVTDLKSLRRQIDTRRPGSSMVLTVYRERAVTDREVRVGRERFQSTRHIRIGLGLSTRVDIDPIPDPSFSLVAAGFHRNQERLEMSDAVVQFSRSMEAAASAREKEHVVTSAEGWNAWLGILGAGSHKQIVSQEAVRP